MSAHDLARVEIGQGQRVASVPRARPAKGDPNVVGTPLIVGTPVWVVGHEAVLCGVESGADGLEDMGRGVSVMAGAAAFGLRATDGGLKPPPPSSVEPSGIPTIPMDDPGPIDEAMGGDAVADAAQAPGALAAIPPPSKGAVPDVPGTEPPIPADAPVTGVPMSADAAVSELPMAADGGTDETPLHVTPSNGDTPDVVGLTPGVASSVAPRGIPVCPTGAFGMPSGDVTPSAGRGEVLMGACAWAAPQPRRTAAVATAKRAIMGSTLSIAIPVCRPAKQSARKVITRPKRRCGWIAAICPILR